MIHKILIALMLLTALSAQVAALESMQGMTYIISPTENADEYEISITVSNITAGGLSIEFPGTFEVVDTNIPAEHYGSEDETFIASLTGETEIYIDVICPKLATGEIIIYWDDLVTGTHGGEELSVGESENEQKNTTNSTKEAPFGYSGIFVMISAAIAGFIAKRAGEKSPGEDN